MLKIKENLIKKAKIREETRTADETMDHQCSPNYTRKHICTTAYRPPPLFCSTHNMKNLGGRGLLIPPNCATKQTDPLLVLYTF